ncbi:hypothetical protein Saro_3041 [Novosphingobium aromaticivorans DSM 12444]|uniref:Uncharacterized protein n=1 Tax=Novosphingobium aromaticivorans (strain ATCC 700278 / DSM 12444 / CCUG 56034 / CIP 105152 / NBRC 16084 / F199) TaxID=279238 RepID=Q2G3U7_NOVAD|nr:hypothetical protein Saro_3041 [Novosphingobium aromaticivorans DSM 12444]
MQLLGEDCRIPDTYRNFSDFKRNFPQFHYARAASDVALSQHRHSGVICYLFGGPTQAVKAAGDGLARRRFPRSGPKHPARPTAPQPRFRAQPNGVYTCR